MKWNVITNRHRVKRTNHPVIYFKVSIDVSHFFLNICRLSNFCYCILPYLIQQKQRSFNHSSRKSDIHHFLIKKWLNFTQYFFFIFKTLLWFFKRHMILRVFMLVPKHLSLAIKLRITIFTLQFWFSTPYFLLHLRF